MGKWTWALVALVGCGGSFDAQTQEDSEAAPDAQASADANEARADSGPTESSTGLDVAVESDAAEAGALDVEGGTESSLEASGEADSGAPCGPCDLDVTCPAWDPQKDAGGAIRYTGPGWIAKCVAGACACICLGKTCEYQHVITCPC